MMKNRTMARVVRADRIKSLSNGTTMAVRDWPESERPRERLLRHGPSVLSEAELLAVFLRTGIAGTSVVDLARNALERFGGLNALLSASEAAFTAIPGFGPAKYAQLQAVLELARRALREEIGQRPLLNSPIAVRDYLRLTLGSLTHETFAVLFLDAQHRLITYEEMFRGTLTHTSVHPREIARRALQLNAGAVILAHNHPSGTAEPSHADEVLTLTLRASLELFDVKVLDHLIITGNSTVSFAERHLL